MRAWRRGGGLALLAGTMLAGACQAQRPAAASLSFEVASVRPSAGMGYTSISPYGTDRFTARYATLKLLIEMAYGVDGNQVSGGPGWLDSQLYDVSAKAEGDKGLSAEQMQPLLQHLLEQRFHLVTHRESREVSGYVLVEGKGGPKLEASKGAHGYAQILPNGLMVRAATMKTLASMLAIASHRPVEDRTGIAGTYDVTLRYAPEDATDSSLPSIYTAVQEQLGLKLASAKVAVEMLVIDHVQREPTEN